MTFNGTEDKDTASIRRLILVKVHSHRQEPQTLTMETPDPEGGRY